MLLEPNQLQQIVDEITQRLSYLRGYTLALTIAMSVLVGFASGVAGVLFTYWKKRAELAADRTATNLRFDEALEQMQRSVQANERIKNEVADVYSRQAMFRNKLEEHFVRLSDLETVFKEAIHECCRGKAPSVLSTHKSQMLTAVHLLYFRGCQAEFSALMAAALTLSRWIKENRQAISAEVPGADMDSINARIKEASEPFTQASMRYQERLIEAYAPNTSDPV